MNPAELLHPRARLIDAATGEVLAGPALQAQVTAAGQGCLAHPPGVMFALMPTTVPAVVAFLGALHARRPVALLDPGLPAATLNDLIRRFRPALVTGVSTADLPPDGYTTSTGRLGAEWVASTRASDPTHGSTAGPAPAHPQLGLLLATSGSTGSPKLVRLSRSAVLANAESIALALGLDGDEVAVTTLPLFYTYGLSVLTSHLRRGATVVLERSGLTGRDFWQAVDAYGVTSLAAVPYQYEILRRLRFDPARYPSLRTLTQAGGRLRPELIADFHARMSAVNGRLVVMYGQTEATARMTVLPPEQLAARLGSVGQAVPGGSLAVRAADGTEVDTPQVTGEVVYRGPNVMMGYAETAADLARPDEVGGVLATGDLGHLDADGFLQLTGRLKRIAKVFGTRVSLDNVERLLAAYGPLAAISGEDTVVIYVEGADAEQAAKIRAELAAELGTHSTGIEVRSITGLPLTPAGKTDYRALEQERSA